MLSEIHIPDFTVVCVSHRPEILRDWLSPSLASQSARLEIRIVDSSTEHFPSCAAALNAGAADARGRYLLFVHHDVAWDSVDFLSELAKKLDALPSLGAAGVVGPVDHPSCRHRDRSRGQILAGQRPGVLTGSRVDNPEEVQTVDELMLIVPATVFQQLKFDEQTCDSWHLYAVDYCLSVRTRGLKVYVLPAVVRHASPGAVDRAYFKTLTKLCRKHRANVPKIYTTCDPWSTRGPDWINPVLFHLRRSIRNVKGMLLTTLIAVHLRRTRTQM